MNESNHKPATVPLSAEMLAVADSLQHVRATLARMVQEECYPTGAFPDISIVLTGGLDVAKALERLASK